MRLVPGHAGGHPRLPEFLFHLPGEVCPPELEYAAVMVSAIVEIPGYVVGGWLADRHGRKLVMLISFALSAAMAVLAGVVALMVESGAVSWGAWLVIACALKITLSAAFLILMVYTAEAYPTLLTSTKCPHPAVSGDNGRMPPSTTHCGHW